MSVDVCETCGYADVTVDPPSTLRAETAGSLGKRTHRVEYTPEDLAWDLQRASYPPVTWEDASRFVVRVDLVVRSLRVAIASGASTDVQDDAWLEGMFTVEAP